ncbi:MAG: PQQ-binding-like beta-propeller repeat protein [Candidatus Hydrogenedentes bacterium]|nr:PQQ-binding-like beta-propeller repeat protein [Candidatus Hydrogenedentota bacterium]
MAREIHAPLRWGPAENVRWKIALPGPGNSSPIVVGGRVFVTCAENQGKKRHLYCCDSDKGTILWVRTVEVDYVEPTHPTNPYCASTPVADYSHVIVWHGSAGVFCYSPDGALIWQRDLGAIRHDWGYASSPILHRGRVFLNFGPGSRTFLAALDLRTGGLLWKYEEPGGSDTTDKKMIGSWSTPVIVKVENRDQVLCVMPTRVIACDAETGALRWFCAGLADEKASLVYPSALVWKGFGIAVTGWVNGPTMGFKLGGAGDVTTPNRLWQARQPQQIGTGVMVDGFAYSAIGSPGSVQCLECQTGKVRWSERLDSGEIWGSLVLAAGRFYVTSRRGVTSVFRAYPDRFELLAQNDLGEPSNATPAIAEGQVFLRTDQHLYCISDQ